GPTADEVELAGDLRAALGVILSIGVRACSGAILVLIFALILCLPWAGGLAVGEMSAGTALSTRGIAGAGAVGREWISVRARRTKWIVQFAGASLAIFVGGLLFLFGSLLLWSSFSSVHPLGIR